MKKIIQLAAVFTMSMFCMSTTCEDSTSYHCDFYNDTDNSVFIYDRLCDARIDSLKAFDALMNYERIYEVKPGDLRGCGAYIPDSDDAHYTTLQIMVFEKSIFENYTLEEIKERNIYNQLYIIPTEALTSGEMAYHVFYRNNGTDL